MQQADVQLSGCYQQANLQAQLFLVSAPASPDMELLLKNFLVKL